MGESIDAAIEDEKLQSRESIAGRAFDIPHGDQVHVLGYAAAFLLPHPSPEAHSAGACDVTTRQAPHRPQEAARRPGSTLRGSNLKFAVTSARPAAPKPASFTSSEADRGEAALRQSASVKRCFGRKGRSPRRA